jgi:hypothetical protein
MKGDSVRYQGLLIKESLGDEGVLDAVHMIRTETWNTSDPPIWTAVYFDGHAGQAGHVAEKLSQALNPGWYCNVATERDSLVVFPGRVFKYPRGDEQGRAEAQEYGRLLGLPEEQLDWGESYPLT